MPPQVRGGDTGWWVARMRGKGDWGCRGQGGRVGRAVAEARHAESEVELACNRERRGAMGEGANGERGCGSLCRAGRLW